MSAGEKDTRIADLVQVMLDEGTQDCVIYWRIVEAMKLVGAQPLLVADAGETMGWVEEMVAEDPDTSFSEALHGQDFGHDLDPMTFAMTLHALRKQWPLNAWWAELVDDAVYLSLPDEAWDHVETVKAYILQRAVMKRLEENKA